MTLNISITSAAAERSGSRQDFGTDHFKTCFGKNAPLLIFIITVYTKQRAATCIAHCTMLRCLEGIKISLSLVCLLWHVCVELGDHSAATVGHCIVRLMMITLSLPKPSM